MKKSTQPTLKNKLPQWNLHPMLNRMVGAIIFIAFFVGQNTNLSAQVNQGFEGITAQNIQQANCLYVDPDASSTHIIQNYTAPCGLITVLSPGGGTTLGFENVFSANGNGTDGFSDGDAIGVANNTSLEFHLGNTAIPTVVAPEGNQAFIMEDIDGAVAMNFGFVDLSGTTNPMVSLQYFLSITTWEPEDFLNIHVEITGCGAATSVSLLNISGTAMDNVEGSWNTLNANLTPYVGCIAQLILEYSANASSEELGIDNIIFTEGVLGAAPAPIVCPSIGTVSSSLASVCLGDPFDLTVTGLSGLDVATNLVTDFGIEFVAFPAPTTTPYVGGVSLGVVPFGSLTNGNTTATITGAMLSMTTDYEIYAILSPSPVDASCRPSASTTVTANGCPGTCSPTTAVGTSFETIVGQNIQTAACNYSDPDVTMHILQNMTAACGEITVNYPGFGNTLGFENTFTPNGNATNGIGFADGDGFGVANNTSINFQLGVSAIDGAQAFIMEDIDGQVSMTFDPVDLTGTASSMFSMNYALSATTFDAGDFLEINLNITGCGAATVIPLVNLAGTAMNSAGVTWDPLSANLTPYIGCQAELEIIFSSNESSEELAIDNIVFTQGCIAGSAPPIVCPTIGTTSVSTPSVCLGELFDLSATGLVNMEMMDNTVTDFGIEFRAHPMATTAPYAGGTSLGVVPFLSLTAGNTTADFTGASLGMTGTFQIYALLSPSPVDGSCRPFAVTSIEVNGCSAPCDITTDVGTSFETIVGQNIQNTCNYFDPDQTMHILQNMTAACGEITVNYPGFGNTLGFENTFTPNGNASNGIGFADGDGFGVANNASINFQLGVSAIDGQQAFIMEDIDGQVTMTFDPVTLVGSTMPMFSMNYALSATGFDAGDFLEINLNITGCGAATVLPLVNLSGVAMNSAAVTWDPLSADLTPYVGCQAELEIIFSSNESSEELAIDNIVFTQSCLVVPIDCPTIGAVNASTSSICENTSFDLTATGLDRMSAMANMVQDLDIEFVAFTTTPADPYTGGTSLGTVPFGSLTGGGTTAAFVGATLATPGVYEIYAILSPAPTDATCRPSAITTIEINAGPTVSFTAPSDRCISAPTELFSLSGSPSGSGGIFSGPGVMDSGDGVNFTFNPATAGVGTHTITYTFTDANGCSASATDNIVVNALPTVIFVGAPRFCINATPPLLNGGSPQGGVFSGTGITDFGNGAAWSFDPVAAGVGAHIGTYTYTDGNGCTNSASVNITVFDQPVVTFTASSIDVCIDDPVEAGLGGGMPTGGVYSGTGVTDDGNGMTFSFDPTASAPAGGNVSVTYTFTDANGCSASASDDIFVDQICCMLAVTCPAPGPVNLQCIDDLPAGPTSVADFNALGGSVDQSCNPVEITFSDNDDMAAGCAGNVRTVIQTISITDPVTLESEDCNITYLIQDTEAPVVTCTEFSATFNRCPDDLGPNIPSGNWFAIGADGRIGTAVGGSSTAVLDLSCISDNCADLANLEVMLSASFEENRIFGCQVDIINEYMVRDACGNVSPVKFNFRGRIRFGGPAPVITCPANVTIECSSASRDPADTGMATATSDCGSPAISFTDAVTPGACPQERTINRTWTATDGCGNAANCVQVITVEDNAPPMITCPANVTVQCDEDTQPQFPITGNTTAANMTSISIPDNDPAGITSTATVAGIPVGAMLTDIEVSMAINHTWVGDLIIELTAPTGEMITLLDRPGVPPGFFGDSSNSDVNGPITFTDAAAVLAEDMGNTIGTNQSICVDDGICEYQPDNGAPTSFGALIMQMITNGSDPNGTWTLSISDNAGIDLGNLDNWRIDLAYSEPAIGGTGIAVGMDNCAPMSGVVIAFTDVSTQTATDCGQYEYEITRTWTATDPCGNGTNCVQVITVEDNSPPMISCPANVTVECDQPTDPGATGDATAKGDNCAADSELTITFNDVSTQTPMGCSQSEYQITRTWTATDPCGNATNCVQMITVEDTNPPMITCPISLTIQCDADTSPANTGAATATDNCAAVAEVVITSSDVSTQTASGCGQYDYQITRTWTATDPCGNATNCVQVITVEDSTPPVIACPANMTNLVCNTDPIPDATSSAGFIAIGGTIADNCSSRPEITVSYTDSPSNQSMLNFCSADPADRTLTRTYTVTDICGNASTCDQTFIYQQSVVGPIITSVPADQTVDCAVNAFPQTHLFEFDIDCGLGSTVAVSGPNTSGTTGCSGSAISYTYTVTDICGRNASHTQTYTLTNEGPEFVCPVDICVIECPADTEMIQAQFDAYADLATVITSCSETSVTISNTFNQNGFIQQNCMNPTVDVEGAVAYQIVRFNATDNCGRNASCTALVVIKDSDGPVMDSGVTFGLADCNDANLQQGYTNWATNQLSGLSATDECSSGTITYSYTPLTANLDCSNGLATTEVSFIATDACGNQTLSNTYYRIIDNGTGAPVSATISGTIHTEDDLMVEAVEMMLNMNAANGVNQMTGEDGAYEFNAELEQNYEIVPSRNGDILNGITTMDLILMGQHLLEFQTLDSPYKMIAADINRSGSITALDMIELRRLILLITDDYTNNTSWRFVDADYIFPNPENPFASTFPEERNINNLAQGEIADFIAVKIGDLNGSAQPINLAATGDTRDRDLLSFNVADQALLAGETYTVDFKARDFKDILGYQFTLEFDPNQLSFVNALEGQLPDFNMDNFGVRINQGTITSSWNTNQAKSLPDDAILFSIALKAKQDIKLSKAISLTSSLTKAEAYSNELAVMNVGLLFDSAFSNAPKFKLYQNTPNPFMAETTIGFTLPEAGPATLTIYDVTGQVLTQITDSYTQGYHQVVINGPALPTVGLLYYQLKTKMRMETRKMIKQ